MLRRPIRLCLVDGQILTDFMFKGVQKMVASLVFDRSHSSGGQNI
jgi:hypothetical protein